MNEENAIEISGNKRPADEDNIAVCKRAKLDENLRDENVEKNGGSDTETVNENENDTEKSLCIQNHINDKTICTEDKVSVQSSNNGDTLIEDQQLKENDESECVSHEASCVLDKDVTKKPLDSTTAQLENDDSSTFSSKEEKVLENGIAVDSVQSDDEAKNSNVQEKSVTESSSISVSNENEMTESLQSVASDNVDDKLETDNKDIEMTSDNKDLDNKENIAVPGELPLDLSRKSSPDCIMLSDDEEPKYMNGDLEMVNGEYSVDEFKNREKLVRRFNWELKNEEAKLVLLKKIRQSQVQAQVQDTGSASSKVASSRPPNAAPPPLVRGGQPAAHSKVNTSVPPQLMRGSVGSTPVRPQNQGPPPLVMAQRSSTTAAPQPSSRRVAPPAHRSSTPQQPEQTPAQRQAAAKLALRKQLEKTLLQIPPPKPPPPEMNFIPSLSNNEFILLVGLEEVVKYLTSDKSQKQSDVKYVFNPFTCIQCGTDFTPVWKRDKAGSRNVICEQCVSSNQKKALKQEHTNRLKSAFVKALQQEQEIEQRMQQQQQQQQQQPQQQQQQRPTTPPSSAKPSSDQIRHHQNLLQAHQAQMRNHALGLQSFGLNALGQFSPRMAFPFVPTTYANTKSTDMHRQYLLDMIPPRSMPGGTVLWKS